MVGFTFLFPAILTTLLFKYYPISKALYMSFFEYKTILNPGEFVGFDNYIGLFNLGMFWKSWSNTLIISFFTIILGFWVPIVQAIFLNKIRKNQSMIRVLYLVPMVIPGIVVAYIWKWIYDPSNGALNSILIKLGFEPLMWLNDPSLVKFSLGLPALLGGGISVLIYLAAIEGIPSELYEAGDIDGINAWQKILYIILPGIKSIIGIQFVLTLITALQIFDLPFIMTQGGPMDESNVTTMLVYDFGFQKLKLGYSSAAAMTIFIVIMLMTIVQLKFSNKEENN
jgi:multiple sugar transport system permease protein